MRTVKLELPDNIYKQLLKKAKQFGQRPEEFILHWTEEAVKSVAHDPLLKLAGVFECDMTDIGEKHDEYIGQNLRNEYE